MWPRRSPRGIWDKGKGSNKDRDWPGSASPEAAGYGGPSAAEPSTRAVITYIDLMAAVGSVSRRFLDESMEEAKCRHKTRAIIRAMSERSIGALPPKSGCNHRAGETERFDVNREVVQGDLFTPVCLIVAPECLVRKADAGGGVRMLQVFLSKLEYCTQTMQLSSIERVSKHRRES